MIKVGIIGATGYAGAEIVRLLQGHSQARVVWYGSRSYIDQKYSSVYGNFFKIVDDKCLDDNMDELAKEVDFFSIGTNALTQYTEACSREAATHRNDELTPAVLKLIYLTVQNARKHRIPVCICGELVHNLNYLALFISIGLRDFSVAPFYLNKLLEKIHELEVRIDLNLATKINAVRTKQEIIELNKSLIAQNFGHSGMID